MSHGQGVQQGAEKMPLSRSSAAPEAFMRQLMALVNPHQTAQNDALHTAQSACGRWIGLRRLLHIRLSKEVLANMLGITPDNLLLLETGLATPELISEAARESLCVRLAPSRADKAWVANVLAIALGQIEALNVPTLDRVFNELELASASPEERTQESTARLPEATQAAVAESIDRELLQREPVMYDVLQAVINSDNDIHAVLARLPSLGPFQAGELLKHMQRERLLDVIGEHLNPAYPNATVSTYQVTPRGRQTFHAERSRRIVEDATMQEATKQAATTPGINQTFLPDGAG